jgi:hypothetical protein
MDASSKIMRLYRLLPLVLIGTSTVALSAGSVTNSKFPLGVGVNVQPYYPNNPNLAYDGYQYPAVYKLPTQDPPGTQREGSESKVESSSKKEEPINFYFGPKQQN